MAHKILEGIVLSDFQKIKKIISLQNNKTLKASTIYKLICKTLFQINNSSATSVNILRNTVTASSSQFNKNISNNKDEKGLSIYINIIILY